MVTDGPSAGKLFVQTIKAPSVWLAFGIMILVRASARPITYAALWSFRFDANGWLAKLGIVLCVLAALSCGAAFVSRFVAMSRKVQNYKRQGNLHEWRIFAENPKNRPSPIWILATIPLINLTVPLAVGLTIWGSINDSTLQEGKLRPDESPQVQLEQTLLKLRRQGIFRLP